MSEWAAKRFWKEATVEKVGDAFTVRLDGRPVKTPAKSLLSLPTEAMAAAIAKEWQAQDDRIDPSTMPVTRSANAALDKTTPQKTEVADLIAAYGETDLLCYRAESPAALVTTQDDAWNPLLDWAETALGARLTPVTGVMFQAQDAGAVSRLTAQVHALDAFELTAFHDLVSISGSLILGFAAIRDHLPADAIWHLSRIDEDWQIAQWGDDEEAAELAETKRRAFLHADRFFRLSQKADQALNH